MSQRQTLSYLSKRLAEVGIKPKSKHGQNFLIDLNLLGIIAATAKLEPTDVVLEVGTGTGGLTALVAPQVAEVVTVEVDPQMHQLASEELIDCENVTLHLGDALESKHRVDEDVLDLLRAKLAVDPRRRLKLVANLPYNIATPLISNLLAGSLVPATMTVTIQKELAERICAAPSTKDYGALSVWVQSQCTAEVVRTMAPSVFWPQPKVDSAILQITLDEARRAKIFDLAYFHRFSRTLFMHRRKFLRSSLVASFKESLSKPEVDEVLRELGFGETSRAEELTVEQILRLAEAFQRAQAKHGSTGQIGEPASDGSDGDASTDGDDD
ncbi:MAG: 16S rRNA (adenine(1518)-N(6)/adenine(1519)-N(6))-dimethyltransferase RsmA [Planctomycetia bacterium]|nr:16S rRNA (adenine(1518)-N(6)/adenine(1519)-N(6))-dimethyltransferase RsmA [Planctomycetia bacterium]